MDQIMKTVPNQYKNGTAFPRKMAGVFNGTKVYLMEYSLFKTESDESDII